MPYAPGINYDFSPLQQGISSFGQNIQAYVARGEKSKGMDAMLKAYLPEDFDSKALAGMSLEEKEALVKGHVMQQDAAERKARLQDYQAQADLRNEQTAQRKQADSAWGQFATGLGTDATLDTGPSLGQGLSAFSNDNMMRRAAESGVLGDPRLGNLLRYSQQQEAGPSLSFGEDPVSGSRFAQYGKQLLPSGSNPDKRPRDATAIHDEEGNVLGYGLPTKNGIQIIKPPVDTTALRPADRSNYERQKTQLMMEANKLGTTPEQKAAFGERISQLDGLLGNQSASPAAPEGGSMTRTNLVKAFLKGDWRKK